MTEDDQIRYLDRKIEYLTENYLDPQAGIYIMQFLGHFSIYYNGLLYKNLMGRGGGGWLLHVKSFKQFPHKFSQILKACKILA